MASFHRKSNVSDHFQISHCLQLIVLFSTVTSFQKCEPCSSEAKCVPAIQCPAHIRMTKQPPLCDLPGNSNTHGLCCTTNQNHTSNDFSKSHTKSRSGTASHVITDAMREAKMEYRMMMHKERNHKSFERSGRLINPGHFHQQVFG